MCSYPRLAFLSLLISAPLLACAAKAAQFNTPPGPLSVSAGQNFSINLRSNPTTGYHWQLAQPLDEKVVRFVDKSFVPSQSKLVGAGGMEIWTFQSTGKGSTQIPLVYVRPWEKDKPPADKTDFQVNVE